MDNGTKIRVLVVDDSAIVRKILSEALAAEPDLELDLVATRRAVAFLIERGMTASNATLLAGGAAGDFSTMTFDERLAIAEAVVGAAAGRQWQVRPGHKQASTSRGFGELISPPADALLQRRTPLPLDGKDPRYRNLETRSECPSPRVGDP